MTLFNEPSPGQRESDKFGARLVDEHELAWAKNEELYNEAQNPEIEPSTAVGLGLAALGYFVFWGLVAAALAKFIFF